MVRLAYVSVFVFLGLAGPAANGAPACPVTAPDTAGCAAGWAAGNRFMIRGESVETDRRVEWHYDFAKNRDLKLRVRIASGETTETGAVFLIDNRAMLTNGLTLTPGQEIDTLGVPVLTLQLVVDLLGRAFPAGPAAVYGKQPLEEADDSNPLKIAVQGAKGIIPPPWRLAGAVERRSASKIAFKLTLAFKPMLDGANEQVMQFSGFWEMRQTPLMLSDATKIDGWAIHRITQFKNSDADLALIDLRATRIQDSFATLGALRRHMSDNFPADR